MNVAMYLRKSRADENNPLETLERHKEILLSYAKDNNLTVIDIFEEVISGGMLYNRTEMLKLLDAIPSHIYDAVLCIDLDRLGRGSAADSEKIFDVLKENDVKIITLKKYMTSTTSTTKITVNLRCLWLVRSLNSSLAE